ADAKALGFERALDARHRGRRTQQTVQQHDWLADLGRRGTSHGGAAENRRCCEGCKRGARPEIGFHPQESGHHSPIDSISLPHTPDNGAIPPDMQMFRRIGHGTVPRPREVLMRRIALSMSVSALLFTASTAVA